MKDTIREKRKLFFTGKIITPQIIREISALIENEVEKANLKKQEYFLMYSVDAIDNTSFESQSPTIFDASGLIEKRVVESIRMEFHTSNHSKKIEVSLDNCMEDSDSDNYIAVSGDDSNWVNGILERLSQIIDSSESRSKFSNYIGITAFIIYVFVISVFINIMNPIVQKQSEKNFIPLIIFFIVPSLLGFLALHTYQYIRNLFPNVELQTGPNHARIPEVNRRKVQIILMTIIMPLVLAFIYDLLKG
ncbi:hypothetical protein ACJD0Z_18700 [Flavobacteriaceae bacterium M23B6Z8]